MSASYKQSTANLPRSEAVEDRVSWSVTWIWHCEAAIMPWMVSFCIRCEQTSHDRVAGVSLSQFSVFTLVVTRLAQLPGRTRKACLSVCLSANERASKYRQCRLADCQCRSQPFRTRRKTVAGRRAYRMEWGKSRSSPYPSPSALRPWEAGLSLNHLWPFLVNEKPCGCDRIVFTTLFLKKLLTRN